MLTLPGQQIGDTWFYAHAGTFHCFYLTCDVSIPRHSSWDIGHATSTDLVHWTVHPLALKKGAADAWDDNLATGSILRWSDRFWMAYCAGNLAHVGVGLAVSDDLFTWTRWPANPVTRIDPRYYEPIGSGSRPFPHWRDPFLFVAGDWVYHYVCASATQGHADERGTLGLACTQNMTDWQVLPPPIVEPVSQELECPQVIAGNGAYHLIFSAIPEFFSSRFLARHSRDEFNASTYTMVGPTPFGPFAIHGSGRILPTDYPVQPYAGQVVVMNDRPYLLGTIIDPGNDAICDPIPLAFTDVGLRAIL